MEQIDPGGQIECAALVVPAFGRVPQLLLHCDRELSRRRLRADDGPAIKRHSPSTLGTQQAHEVHIVAPDQMPDRRETAQLVIHLAAVGQIAARTRQRMAHAKAARPQCPDPDIV